jgi:hypothetical protein
MYNWTRPGGIKEIVDACQAALTDRDSVNSEKTGADWKEVCEPLKSSSLVQAVDIYQQHNHGWYDIGHPHSDPFPAPYSMLFLSFLHSSVLPLLLSSACVWGAGLGQDSLETCKYLK